MLDCGLFPVRKSIISVYFNPFKIKADNIFADWNPGLFGRGHFLSEAASDVVFGHFHAFVA
jgi:hypothetical protein